MKKVKLTKITEETYNGFAFPATGAWVKSRKRVTSLCVCGDKKDHVHDPIRDEKLYITGYDLK